MQYNRNYPAFAITSQTDDNNDDSSDDEDKRTIYCRNLSDKVSEELLCELFIQAGPVESVRIPNDKDGRSRNFGFVTYVHSCSVRYALELFDGVQLFNRILFMRPNYNANNQSQSRLPALPPNLSNRKPFDNEALRKSSLLNNNLALRLGGSSMSTSSAKNSHIRFDKDMQPKKSKEINKRNPFKVDLDTLSRLSSNLFLPKEKGQKLENNNNNGKKNKNKSGNSSSNFGGKEHQKHKRVCNINSNDHKNEKISKNSSRNNNFRERDKLNPYKKPEKKQRDNEKFDKGGKAGYNTKNMTRDSKIQRRRR